jgi:hypothetical protein
MAYNRHQARPLLTKQEFQLFEASLSDKVGSLSAPQLRAKIDRARGLADKYRDLFRRQARATREKTGSGRGMTGAANERTEKKAQIFGEALARFEARLEKVEARKAAAGKPKTPGPRARARASTKKGATRSKRRTTRSNVKSADATAARKHDTTKTPRNTKINAHISGQGRRNQARRDGKR